MNEKQDKNINIAEKRPKININANLTDEERVARNTDAKAKYDANKAKILARRKELYQLKHKAKKQEYYIKNKDSIVKSQLERYHSKPASRRNSLYYSNKEAYNEVTRLRHNRYYSENTQFKVKTALRDLLNKLLKYGWKNRNLAYVLGCSCDDFIEYIESKFLPGMSWDNRSEWHLDHIQPIRSFDLSVLADIKKCYHYTNFQVLWAKANLSKSGKCYL